MKINQRNFPLGKLKHQFLEKLLKNYVSHSGLQDDRVIMGSKIGEDAAVIDMGSNYLVAKTDPITFVTNEIGYYAVNVNANDVACMGAKPKWFQSTILLPENNTNEELIENIFKDIYNACKSLEIAVIGGHTEITTKIDRPIVIGSLLGEVDKDKLVLTSGAGPGDALILTKGIFIEGTSIIGQEKEKDLVAKGYNSDFIEKCKNYLHNPGISVLKEALLSNKHFKIHSMHDPTEGGLATSIAEMVIASDTGVIIDSERIKILPEPKVLSKIFNLNPLNTISSGSLLIAVEQKDSSDLINILNKNNINAEKIGNFESKEKGLMIKEKDGSIKPLSYSETDEITKIF